MIKAPSIVGDLSEELAGAEIPDWRLRERLIAIATALDEAPAESLPEALKSPAAREGAYRFLGNARVSPEGILAPHIAATVGRAKAHGKVYVVSDTSEFSFSGDRGSRLGRLQGDSRGFLGHFALAISADGTRRPLGVVGMELLVRSDERQHRNIYQRKKDPDRESPRLAKMAPGLRTPSKRNGPRAGRLAPLQVSCRTVTLRRPKTCTTDYPSTIPVNVVRVFEPAPPEGQDPVEWILFTSEPISKADEVASIVDGYRSRWLIEEYFKAIKTGCAYETRQLESLRTLSNLLAVVADDTRRQQQLRAVHRFDKDRKAAEVIAPDLLEALAERLRQIGERKPLPPVPSVDDALNAIARLGGHIKSNGLPGWQVLWRGYQDLLAWAAGYIRGKSAAYCHQS